VSGASHSTDLRVTVSGEPLGDVVREVTRDSVMR
jgi:hypothetical protein